MSSDFCPPLQQAMFCAALGTIFRGKFCDVVLPGRRDTTFGKGEVVYDIGDEGGALLFIRSGFVKVESLTEDGRELIYDVRKAGDVVGELCAYEQRRSNRAIALEPTTLVAVPFEDVLDAISMDRHLLRELVQVFCGSLSSAYKQLDSVAVGNTVHKLTKLLVRLGNELGRDSPHGTEISTRLTQEEIAQMIAVSRERLSMAMNFLRARGLVDYSRGGYIVVNLVGLAACGDGGPDPTPAPIAQRTRESGAQEG